MALLKTAVLAVAFGSLYTIFRKYQSVVDLKDEQTQFNQPILQSFLIFVGMCSIAFFRPWMSSGPVSKQEQALPEDNKFLYIMPSLLDVLGTIVDTTGLYYTSVSVSQMLKGSVLFFTYLITLFYLKRSLSPKKHLYMVAILSSLLLIGTSNLDTAYDKFESNPLLGNILIIISQLLFSLMFIYEEKILRQYRVKVQNAVFWEGIWGVAISGVVLIAFSIFQSPLKQNVVHSCVLICNNWKLLAAVALTALSIAPFNYFGISLTKQGSALQRCMICTSRMIVVWTISLLFGWEDFHLGQLIGYSILTYSIYQFNHSEQTPQNAEMNYEEELRLREQQQARVLETTMSESIADFWRVFSHYLTVNSSEEPTYLLTRQHIGSYFAFALAGYNTFLLRQKILKNAIALTRSTHPRTVIAASIGVGFMYFVGLAVVWHVPSFFAELAVRVYCSAENAATTVLMREWLREELLSEGRVKYILRDLS